MLNRNATNAEIEAAVHRVIADVLERTDREVPAFENKDELVATGLRSLDLATIVAVLERELKADPFLEFRSITEVRTVGDLCRAYQDFIHGEDGALRDDALSAAQSRGKRRMR